VSRLAIVVCPALAQSTEAVPGALDGDLMRARLPLADCGFTVVDLDPASDLAEQLDVLFDEHAEHVDAPILFYASTVALATDAGELFLCLDPAHPEVGDGLADLAAVFAERQSGPVLFLLDCRHAPDPDDPFRSATIVSAARDAVDSRRTGIELLVAARSTEDVATDVPSPFSRAVVEALDEADPAAGLTASALYDRLRATDRLVGLVPAYAHARGRAPFDVLRPEAARDVEVDVALDAPPPSSETRADSPVDAPPTEPSAEPPALVPVFPLLRGKRDTGADAPRPPEAAAAPAPPPSTPTVPAVGAVERTSAAPASSMTPPVSSTTVPSARPSSPFALHVSTVAELLAAGDALARAGSDDEALEQYKKALGLLAKAASRERAEVYVRVGGIKRRGDKLREAISNFEKALALEPAHALALEALLDLSVALGDLRGAAAAEDRLLASLTDPDEACARLRAFAARWAEGGDRARARARLERARDLSPDDVDVLGELARLHDADDRFDDALALRRRIAALTLVAADRARALFALARACLARPEREELGMALLDEALDADPSLLAPLELVASHLADRQEWSELERAYRKMLARAPRIADEGVRARVRWELLRRLAQLFRDHLVDPALALDAFEDALRERPDDLGGRLTAADLAREIDDPTRAARHLEAAARLDPSRVQTYHELFECFTATGAVDRAFLAASVTRHLDEATPAEAAIYAKHRAEGLPQLRSPLSRSAWDLLGAGHDVRHVDAVLEAIAAPAIACRVAELGATGRLPKLDPGARQDPEKSTVSIVRSLKWASHFLGVPTPAVYVRDDAGLFLAAVPAAEPSAVVGGRVLRGRAPADLAFLAARHLAYYAGATRLLLYYPSIDDLSTCFLAAVTLALPSAVVPPALVDATARLRAALLARLGEADERVLRRAVEALQAAGLRADLEAWVGAVERTVTRVGFLFGADLGVAVAALRDDATGLLSPDDKIADLCAFAVSSACHEVRAELGLARQG
jgi:tetratricopeptide (TPR) repeat protein